MSILAAVKDSEKGGKMLKFMLIFILLMSMISFSAFSGEMEKQLLPACLDKPNCVISIGADSAPNSISRIEPFHYTGEPEMARELLIKTIEEYSRAKIIKQEGSYLHSTFTSMVFRFVDDVVFLFVEDEKLIHVRSASRTGYFDFGANRKRVEALRKSFTDPPFTDPKWDRNGSL